MTAEIEVGVRRLELKDDVLLITMEGGHAADGRLGQASIVYHDGAPRGIGMEVVTVVGATGNGLAVAGEQAFVVAGTMRPLVYGWPRRNGHE